MVPLVCRRITDVALDLVDDGARDLLAATARAAAARALAASTELAGVVAALTVAGVESIAYKGPALAADAYGSAELRPCNDLDVVVAPERVELAAAALAPAGYAPTGGASWREAAGAHDWQGHVALSATGRTLPVELHWRFCDRKLAWNPPIVDVIARSATITIAGTQIRVPELHDQLLLVLLHAARHGWDRLEPLACVAALLQRGSNGETLINRARAVGGLRACLVGLALTRLAFGVHLPVGVANAIADDRTLRGLLERAERRLRAGDAGDARDFRLHLASLDGVTARVRYVVLAAALPTPRDFGVVRFPRALRVLYFPLRLLRLAGRALNVTKR